VISGDWRDWWVYWVGPLIGMFGGVALYRYTWLRKVEIRVAKLYHFDHNPRGVFSEIEHLEGVAGQLAGPVDEEEGS
jgi:hypothetical protein